MLFVDSTLRILGNGDTMMRPSIFHENRLLEAVVRTSPAGLLLIDEYETVLCMNPRAQEWFGYASHELLGRPLNFLIPDAHCPAHSCGKARPIHPGENNRSKQLLALCKDGSTFRADLRFERVQAGTSDYLLVSLEKSTLQSQSRFISDERLKAVDEMVKGLSHECRNALQRARACLDLLELDLESKPDCIDLTSRIRRALADLERNYEEVKEYSAPMLLECRIVDLRESLEAAFAELMDEYAGHDFQLVVQLASDEAANCKVDPMLMRRVFRNLLENAMHASEDGSELRIEFSRSSTADGRMGTRICVRDAGTGIPPENRERIFTPFFTSKNTGNGLGLAICRRIIEAHGGAIELAIPSDHEEGTRIEIFLPED